jgi:ferric-dicitrate binding protein FerR (iron transport regulator)
LESEQFKKILERYVSGMADEDENQIVENWYASYDDETAMQEFSESGKVEAIRTEMETAILNKRDNTSGRKISLFKQYYKYAAVLALILPALFFGKKFFRPSHDFKKGIESESFNIVETKPGEYKKVVLADQSVIQMNPKTKLRIPAEYALKSSGEPIYSDRSVFLDEGEAFFEVTKDPKHPFVVHTAQIKTRVLGTKFAVSTQPKAITEVSVSEGKVEVSDSKKVFDRLLPGKRLSYNSKTSKWKTADFATREHNAWFEQVTDLDHASFTEVAKVMRVNYGVVLKGSKSATANYQYNLQIRSTRSLDQTMKIICSVHQNKYRRIGNEVVLY